MIFLIFFASLAQPDFSSLPILPKHELKTGDKDISQTLREQIVIQQNRSWLQEKSTSRFKLEGTVKPNYENSPIGRMLKERGGQEDVVDWSFNIKLN